MGAPRETKTTRKCPCGEGWIIMTHVEINPNSDYSRNEDSARIDCPKCEKEWEVNKHGELRKKQ